MVDMIYDFVPEFVIMSGWQKQKDRKRRKGKTAFIRHVDGRWLGRGRERERKLT